MSFYQCVCLRKLHLFNSCLVLLHTADSISQVVCVFHWCSIHGCVCHEALKCVAFVSRRQCDSVFLLVDRG